MKDPVEHAALYQELINVTTEIKSLEPVLLSPDAPVLTANSAAGTVFTKTKVGADGSRYLFAYNYTAAPVTAEFTLAAAGDQRPRLRHRAGVRARYQHDFLWRVSAVPGARLSHRRFRIGDTGCMRDANRHAKRDAVAHGLRDSRPHAGEQRDPDRNRDRDADPDC